MSTYYQKSFTLLELLITIGILGVLVVTVLVTLNPQEAQRKTRDTRRIRDLSTLQTAMQQYVNAGSPSVCTVSTGCTTSTSTNTNCNSGWISGANLCPYLSSLPIDPVNGATRQAVNDSSCGTASLSMIYRVRMDADGDYEINVRQESDANCDKVTQDGGGADMWVETGSDLTLLGA